jgi:hypothetical protein
LGPSQAISSGTIAGIIVGVGLIVIIIALAVLFYKTKQMQYRHQFQNTDVLMEMNSAGVLERERGGLDRIAGGRLAPA